jgi:arylsulfatase A
MKPVSLFCLILLGALMALGSGTVSAAPRPNILLILADDLGYGDVQCNNPRRGRIPTPNIDRLAAQGMRFTDAHTSSGVCSPTRYTLLTGRYHWRTRLQAGIVNYLEGPLIAPDRLTLAALLKQHGYRTAAIGKWHLGWDWSISQEQRPLFAPGRAVTPPVTEAHRAAWKEVYARPIGGGPTTRGFDTYFGTDVPNWPPYCFIENDRTVGIPGEFLPADQFKNHLASLGGPALPGWKLEGILPALTDRACAFIERSAKQPEPFFLYLPLTTPHTPLAVNREWQGKSGLGTYGDLVMETDAAVGRVLAALDRSGAADKTIVIFTSDNGCAPLVGVKNLEAQGHFPSGPLRGYKADVWEGGHRVPFIVRWPGVVKAGSHCDQLVMQADFMATFAEVLGAKLPANAGEDSFSLLPLLRGADKPIRQHAISHASSGLPSLRQGSWKIIFGAPAPAEASGAKVQLYNLAADLGETTNLAAERPALVAELTAVMDRLVNEGRSTPGAKQTNDVNVNWKRFLEVQDALKRGAKKAKD